METMFYGKHRRPRLSEGVMDSVSKTETAGYIPAEVQINMFIEAGRRLDRSRKEQFDFAEGEIVPDDFMDPTRSKGFDMADASMMSREVAARIRSKAKKPVEVKKEDSIEEDKNKE